MTLISSATEDIRDLARSIARKRLTDQPIAATDDAFSPEKVKALAEAGLLGMGLPTAVGGGGAKAIDLVVVTEELAKVSTSAAFVFSAQNGLGAKAIAVFGNAALQERYLPQVMTGEVLTGWGMSEPGGGSDIGRMRTRAKPVAGGYEISGEKTWISMAEHAQVFVVIVRFDDVPGVKGLGAVVIDRDDPGLTVGPHIETMGINGSGMASVFLDGCFVPAENVLIPVGGYRELLEIMSSERITSNPPISLGLASAAFDATVGYMKQREAFGKPLAEHQGLQWKLTEMAVDLEAARLLVYRAALNIDAGKISIAEAALAKIAANECAIKVTGTAIQIHGAAGYSREVGIERLNRDARGMAIGDGSVEIQRNLLASMLLKAAS